MEFRSRDLLLGILSALLLLGLFELTNAQCTSGSNYNYKSCGACNFDCTSAPNTIPSCTNGICDCIVGYANCDGNNANGCETRIPTNLPNFQCFGNGQNGALDTDGATRYLNIHISYVTSTSGSRVINVGSTATFFPGELVLIHQTQFSAFVGGWEYNRISSIPSSTQFVLEADMLYAYQSGAQITTVPQFTDAQIVTGDVTAPSWNGQYGGILAFMASGTVTLGTSRSINMNSAGFRGQGSSACEQRCVDGFPGEGYAGIFGSRTRNRFGNGGGGGAQGQDCGFGAGGGNGDFGNNCPSPTSKCTVNTGNAAIGGTVVGSSNLRQSFFLGGAGGSGGGDEDGIRPGYGGNGGGAIIVHARNLVMASNSAITADGARGEDGIQTAGCGDGGNGGGMAGGGGGAGGVVRIVATTMTSSGSVVARGGTAGNCGNGGGPSNNYGHGAIGRTELRASGSIGTFNPSPTTPS